MQQHWLDEWDAPRSAARCSLLYETQHLRTLSSGLPLLSMGGTWFGNEPI